MNYHEWSKNASPYANALSPEITCSTCNQCGKDFKRDDRMQFNPLRCYACMGLSQMQGQYADVGHYNTENVVRKANIGHLDTSNGQFLDSPYGGILGVMSRFING